MRSHRGTQLKLGVKGTGRMRNRLISRSQECAFGQVALLITPEVSGSAILRWESLDEAEFCLVIDTEAACFNLERAVDFLNRSRR